MRVLLDTNVLISYLLKPQQQSRVAAVIQAAVSGRFTLLLPREVEAELFDAVAKKRYLADRISLEAVAALIDILAGVAEIVQPLGETLPVLSRDGKDDYLLVHAVAGQADYLVTGDDDLLSLATLVSMKIVTPSAFMEVLDAGS